MFRSNNDTDQYILVNPDNVVDGNDGKDEVLREVQLKMILALHERLSMEFKGLYWGAEFYLWFFNFYFPLKSM